MQFYRRYHTDGSCVVICTQCFATLGSATRFAAADDMERRHICGRQRRAEFSDAALRSYPGYKDPVESSWARFMDYMRKLDAPRATLLFLVMATIVYGFPTLIEFVLMGRVSPWVVSIVFGDMVGCACLAVVLRMPRTGVILYLALAVWEAWLFQTARITPSTLAWITDAVPTLVVGGRIAQLRLALRWSRDAV